MKITANGMLVGAAGLGALYLLTRERDGVFRPVTPDATNAYFRSSLGDLTTYAMDWATNGWDDFGSGWDWTYSGPPQGIEQNYNWQGI